MSEPILMECVGQPPERGSLGACAYDLRASEDFFVEAHSRSVVPTDLRISLPQGVAGLVLSRSGLAAKNGIHVLNSPGLIDSDFRGQIQVILRNTSFVDFRGKKGDRIAQLLIVPHFLVSFRQVESLEETGRGSGGLGSTGIG